MMTSNIEPMSAVSPIPANAPRFFEALTYPEIGVTLGVRHIAGAGYRVIVRTAEGERHMSPQAARHLAGELDHEDPEILAVLQRAAAGLLATADQLEALLTRPAEGNA